MMWRWPQLRPSVRFIEQNQMDTEEQTDEDAGKASSQLSTDKSWLKRETAIGYAQLEAGQTVEVRSKAEFIALVGGGR